MIDLHELHRLAFDLDEGHQHTLGQTKLLTYDRAVRSPVTLYRPVGQKELELIRASSMREFPPRLPSQPIFYPVLNEEYATTIARDWNTKDERSGYRGYVLRFEVDGDFIDRYEVHRVGGRSHDEYWIPAEELGEFNRHILGEIEIVAEFSGGAG